MGEQESPDSNVPSPERKGTQQVQGAAKWDISLVLEGKCVCVAGRDRWEPNQRKTAPHLTLGAYSGWCAV